jgi:hypothetical protein
MNPTSNFDSSTSLCFRRSGGAKVDNRLRIAAAGDEANKLVVCGIHVPLSLPVCISASFRFAEMSPFPPRLLSAIALGTQPLGPALAAAA